MSNLLAAALNAMHVVCDVTTDGRRSSIDEAMK